MSKEAPFPKKALVVRSAQWPPSLQALVRAQSPARSPVAYHPFRFNLLTRVPLASKCDVGSCGLRNVMWVPPSCGASRGCPPHCPPKLTSGFLNRAPTPLPHQTMLRVRSGRGRNFFFPETARTGLAPNIVWGGEGGGRPSPKLSFDPGCMLPSFTEAFTGVGCIGKRGRAPT